jgi:hypothetical protein
MARGRKRKTTAKSFGDFKKNQKNRIREDRRQKQQKELDDFKSQLKVVPNTGGTLFQEPAPKFNPNTGRYERTTLAQKQMELANKYGPTFSEILQDMGGGISSAFKGFAEKGPPILQIIKGINDKFKGGVRSAYDNLRNTFKGKSQFVVPQAGGTIFEGRPIETEVLNPLFKQQNFEPFRVSNMDMSGVMASNVGQNIFGNLQNLQNLAQQYNLDNIQFDPFNLNRIGYEDQFMFNDTPINYNIYGTPQGGGFNISVPFKDGGSVNKYSGLGYMFK